MNCPRCGKSYAQVDNFCSFCGTVLTTSLLGYRHASLFWRTLAYLIDLLLILIPLTFIILYHLYNKYGELLFEPTLFSSILVKELPMFAVVSVLVFFLYFSLLEGRFQATIGKKLLGIRVVRKDFAPIGYSEAVTRNALRLIWDLPIIGLLLMILDIFLVFDRHQRLGDIVARTYVISA